MPSRTFDATLRKRSAGRNGWMAEKMTNPKNKAEKVSHIMVKRISLE